MRVADTCVRICFVPVGANASQCVLHPVVAKSRAGVVIATFFVGVAIIGKLVTGWAVWGKPEINRLAIGVGMIPRGEVGLVFAGIGTASGVLDRPLEAAIIVMVIITTFLAPPLLQFVMRERPATEVITTSETLSTVE